MVIDTIFCAAPAMGVYRPSYFDKLSMTRKCCDDIRTRIDTALFSFEGTNLIASSTFTFDWMMGRF
jgi:hypothetical protein